jgi:hypothetical protein
MWWKLPATVAGGAALVLGLSAANDLRRLRRRQRAARGTAQVTGILSAWLGVGLGTAGILLGPLLFAGAGRDLRQAFGRRGAKTNLEAIGRGLNAYHTQHDRFPPGGAFQSDNAGNERPMHGWMTFLLPYIGEETLYRSIDLERPYSDAANFPALSRDVPLYFTPGADRSKVGSGLGAAHFAGVGGEVIEPKTGLLHFGVFERNSQVRRDDVTDGLSHTVIAGEIAHRFPPWGDPSNWRPLTGGLNADPRGFGNVDGSGAMFLHADGSVRFYSNQTSPRTLQQLGTRDGGETMP